MSDTPFEVVKVKIVESHPNADRLEIIKVLNTQFITQKGKFQPGELCVYFPPDMLLNEYWGKLFGIANYLKHSVFPNNLQKSRCRIGAIRLRGVVSFGFGIALNEFETVLHDAGTSISTDLVEGTDVTKYLQGVKYNLPIKVCTNRMRQPAAFHTYTNIQHYYRNADVIPVGTPVRIAEKIHGTNSRVALVMDDGVEFMCGTHHQRVQSESDAGRLSLYWVPLTTNMKDMLVFISRTHDNVIVFGEIYGYKVQTLDYGCEGGKGYRAYDISVNGEYLDWRDVRTYCELFDIETVPLLYEGPFSPDLINEYVDGPTSLAEPDQIRCDFKGREGIVITPLEEQFCHDSHSGHVGRLILKAVSADYYEKVK